MTNQLHKELDTYEAKGKRDPDAEKRHREIADKINAASRIALAEKKAAGIRTDARDEEGVNYSYSAMVESHDRVAGERRTTRENSELSTKMSDENAKASSAPSKASAASKLMDAEKRARALEQEAKEKPKARAEKAPLVTQTGKRGGVYVMTAGGKKRYVGRKGR